MPYALAGIHNVPSTYFPRYSPKRLDGLNPARIGGYVGDGDEHGAELPRQFDQVVYDNATFGTVIGTNDADTEPFLQRQKRELIGDIIVVGSQNYLARPEWNSRQCFAIGVCSAVGDSDVTRLTMKQLRRLRIKIGQLLTICRCRFVAPIAGFVAKV